MTDSDHLKNLAQLDQKLAKARQEQEDQRPKGGKSGKATGIAYRIAIELVLAVVVSVYIGYLLDSWLETKPLFLVIFFFLGVAAGIKNVIRASEQMQKLSDPKNDTESKSGSAKNESPPE